MKRTAMLLSLGLLATLTSAPQTIAKNSTPTITDAEARAIAADAKAIYSDSNIPFEENKVSRK